MFRDVLREHPVVALTRPTLIRSCNDPGAPPHPFADDDRKHASILGALLQTSDTDSTRTRGSDFNAIVRRYTLFVNLRV